MDKPALKMEASAVAAPTAAGDTVGGALRQRPSRPAPSRARDPFRLGMRIRRGGTGEEGDVWVPLTAEDLVYPEEGDIVSDGYPHFSFLAPMGDALRRHLEKRPGLLVTSNVTLVLGDGKNSGPDVAVIEGDVTRSEIKRAIKLHAVGGRLVFVLEAVSTSEKEIEDKDLEQNLERYAREGVEEYFTVYPVLERRVRDLVGRELRKGRLKNDYVEIPPDREGRVYSKKLDLFFQIDAATEELVAIDATTGQRLLISDEEEEGRKTEAVARKAAELRATEEAEQREASEFRATEEAEQRKAAERRAAEAERNAAQSLRKKVEELCGVLEIEWTAERSAHTENLSVADLEALWTDLLDKKHWP